MREGAPSVEQPQEPVAYCCGETNPLSKVMTQAASGQRLATVAITRPSSAAPTSAALRTLTPQAL